jgi:hypothetical protein
MATLSNTAEASVAPERDRLAAPALAIALGAIAYIALILMTRNFTFFADEWNIIFRPSEWSGDSLFAPFNEHIYVAPIVIYKVLLGAFGMSALWPFQTVNLVALLIVVGLVFVYVRARLGDGVALATAALLLFLGPAWEDLLWPAGISFLGALAAGLGALFAIEGHTRRGDAIACLLLVVSLSFSTLGLVFAVGALVDVLIHRDRPWQRAYVIAVPIGLYLIWYAAYGHDAESAASLDNLLNIPAYVWSSVAAAIASLVGLSEIDADNLGVNIEFGIPVLVVSVVGAVWLARARPDVLSRTFWVVGSTALAFWALAGLNEIHGREPGASRYQFIGAVFVVLIAAELLRGRRLVGGARWLFAALAAAALVSNIGALRQGQHYLRFQSQSNLATLAALDGARAQINPAFVIGPDITGTPFLSPYPASTYFAAVDRWGSPAENHSDPADQPEGARQNADRLLAAALGLALVPVSPSDVPDRSADCSTVKPDPGSASAAFDLPEGGALVAADRPVEMQLRRWSDADYPVDLGTSSSPVAALAVPADSFAEPWTAEVRMSAPVKVCPLSPVQG